MKQQLSDMAQAWAEKRLAVFKKLKTKPQDWVMGSIRDFRHRERKTKKGDIVIDWIPVYKIPDGFTNPFGDDGLQSEEECRCQLCDHKIVYHGVILHHATNQFLIIGDTCVEKYETDDDKRMKIELLSQIKDRFVMERLMSEKKRLTDLVTEGYRHGSSLQLLRSL